MARGPSKQIPGYPHLQNIFVTHCQCNFCRPALMIPAIWISAPTVLARSRRLSSSAPFHAATRTQCGHRQCDRTRRAYTATVQRKACDSPADASECRASGSSSSSLCVWCCKCYASGYDLPFNSGMDSALLRRAKVLPPAPHESQLPPPQPPPAPPKPGGHSATSGLQ